MQGKCMICEEQGLVTIRAGNYASYLRDLQKNYPSIDKLLANIHGQTVRTIADQYMRQMDWLFGVEDEGEDNDRLRMIIHYKPRKMLFLVAHERCHPEKDEKKYPQLIIDDVEGLLALLPQIRALPDFNQEGYLHLIYYLTFSKNP